jgi:hypothetical protein
LRFVGEMAAGREVINGKRELHHEKADQSKHCENNQVNQRPGNAQVFRNSGLCFCGCGESSVGDRVAGKRRGRRFGGRRGRRFFCRMRRSGIRILYTVSLFNVRGVGRVRRHGATEDRHTGQRSEPHRARH